MIKSRMANVVVGLSGGVDSSVAAYLLKKQGHDVQAVYMQNYHNTEGLLYGSCAWEEDVAMAELLAKKLDIPFKYVDFSAIYQEKVIDYLFREYKNGRTPNPDVLCNQEVKFDVFLNEAIGMGADYIATGHYARIVSGKSGFSLLTGTDPGKDQSYFLCRLNQYQLSKSLFPIGHLYKKEVRKLAQQLDLPTANRKDSQGICFVGKVNLPDFLKQKLAPQKGQIIEIPSHSELYHYDYLSKTEKPAYTPNDGKIIGEHQGAHYFTIGQRKGLGIGGKKDALFVIHTDTQQNIVYVGEGQNHPGLYGKQIKIKDHDIHWLHPGKHEIKNYLVRIRYRQALQDAWLSETADGLIIHFDRAQRAVSPGQFAVWYDGDVLTGSGIIS